MDNREDYLATDWEHSRKKAPSPDYLSSSRKRLAPQLIFKGGILHSWGRKQAVAVPSGFYNTLPMPEVVKEKADIAWLIYDLVYDTQQKRYNQTLSRIVYTQFRPALDKITLSEAGSMGTFLVSLQAKLDAKLEGASIVQLADEPDLIETLENL